MIIIDSHLDLGYNVLQFNRDLRLTVQEIRDSEKGMMEKVRGRNTVAFPEMREGKVAVALATVLARAWNPADGTVGSAYAPVAILGDSKLDYRNKEIAYAAAQGQLAYYRIMESQGEVRLIKDSMTLAAHLGEWKKSGGEAAPLGFILSMEGADPIISPSQLDDWWNDGLRVVGLTHYGANRYGHGTGSSGGLTSLGIELLKAMEEVGVVLDVSHLADESYRQALDRFHGPVLASHTNCRSLVPGLRQFTDEQIRHLIERNSVIGAVCDAWMLYPQWELDKTRNSVVTLEAFVDQIDHVCQVAGNARHSAIGSDLDGGFGAERCPCDLDTIADLQKVPELLRKRGYKEDDILDIMHGNWIRFFEAAWNS